MQINDCRDDKREEGLECKIEKKITKEKGLCYKIGVNSLSTVWGIAGGLAEAIIHNSLPYYLPSVMRKERERNTPYLRIQYIAYGVEKYRPSKPSTIEKKLDIYWRDSNDFFKIAPFAISYLPTVAILGLAQLVAYTSNPKYMWVPIATNTISFAYEKIRKFRIRKIIRESIKKNPENHEAITEAISHWSRHGI